ncbi:MAG: PilZ domain-containing protein [Pseudobdellovibrio sp.]
MSDKFWMTGKLALPARRKFPRKYFRKNITFLCRGKATVVEGIEIGEGGISFKSDFILDVNQQIIISFFISDGDFFSVRTTLKNKQSGTGHFIYGAGFDDISIALKRQIRAYVARKSTNQFELA